MFAVDQFLLNSTEADMKSVYNLVRNVKSLHVTQLLSTLGFIANQHVQLNMPVVGRGMMRMSWPEAGLSLAIKEIEYDQDLYDLVTNSVQ
jgi:hypothetical protein